MAELRSNIGSETFPMGGVRSEQSRTVASPSRPAKLYLVGIKALHTVVWLAFAGCIVAIPFAGAWRHFRQAAILTSFVLVECVVLAINRGRCPLTDLAGRYTVDRRDNFDIYLPQWLARYNKQIFGTLFAVGILFTSWQWLIFSASK